MVLAVAQFMVLLDVTIVNIALPGIETLGFSSTTDLQWVVSAYALVFGGFLLLGGRLADLVGRRRIFLAGLLLFGLASLLAGLASTPEQLIALRAVQALGGALLSPAAFGMVTLLFAHGRQRAVALSIWGALAGLGGTFGAILGGIVVDQWSWRWIFLVNVPIAAMVTALAMLLLPESKAPSSGKRTFDVAGALLSTAGLLAVVLGVIRSDASGWLSAEVVGLLTGGVVLLALFAWVERRSAGPLVPLSLFRTRTMSGSTIALTLNGAAFLILFFLASIFFQQVRHYSALEAGLRLLPMGVTGIIGAVAAARLVNRFGTRPVQIGTSALAAAGLVLLSRADSDSSYALTVMPGLALFGVGVVGTLTVGQISAVADVLPELAATASGVINTGRQVGGAVGVAVVTTVSSGHVTALLADGVTTTEALVGGFQRGLLVAAAFAVGSAIASALTPQVHVDPVASDTPLVPSSA
ncbi:DHA2 family efflux MFS transporter permease subunit [Paractinoplanes hotanensis]|uniref:DHA2 family efflux MFS transporter permease subunit n=1 Tax=Paractinoplanes hotanensis TaxID=2906497 RepID=A0ABT0YE27_9ACTN|nr:DHA2 family efflux MFS transporter permease subunit [Actinoplanes hotanensis]MCM4084311.1 DHA2 family efflux MFS transporter permease subunit [Actinoplanes hotanensis]